VLQSTWDTYKERYLSQSATGPGIGAGALTQRLLSEELRIKVIQSKKGPLYVKESADPKGKAAFASLGPGQTFETATREQAEAAFAAVAEVRRGEVLGTEDGHEILKKRGPYGVYVEWNGQRLSVKPEMTLEEIVAALKTKAEVVAYTRVVGEYTIKRGPYGLYFFKHGLKKVTFRSLPESANAESVTTAELNALYSAKAKPKEPKATKAIRATPEKPKGAIRATPETPKEPKEPKAKKAIRATPEKPKEPKATKATKETP
jgi:topoisomerase IA-like protein